MFTSRTTSDYSSSIGISQLAMEIATTKWKYNTNNNHTEVAPNCPRCSSSNTKFCYYNNYSLSQPRYFCKGCRRYWTKGGSLRNVPVGGGCRKSRRSRASARQGGATANYAAPTLGSVGSAKDSNSSAFIDMAAVFAKYVGQNEESFSPGASSGSSDNVQASSLDVDDQVEDVRMFEYQQPLDLIYGGDDQIQQVIPQLPMCQDITGQDLVYQEPDAFGLHQGVLGDELVADILWSEGTTLLDFGLDQQPMVQVQNYGPDSPDHQLRISSNLVADNNWGSFDLSAAYEFYSTP